MDSGPRQKHYCESDFCTLSFLISRHHREIAAQKPFPRRRAALGVRKPSKCRKRWFLANCGSSASLQPLEPGHSIDQKYTEGIGTTLTPRRLKCNAPDPAQSKRRYGQQETRFDTGPTPCPPNDRTRARHHRLRRANSPGDRGSMDAEAGRRGSSVIVSPRGRNVQRS